jgi:hypothetical protein
LWIFICVDSSDWFAELIFFLRSFWSIFLLFDLYDRCIRSLNCSLSRIVILESRKEVASEWSWHSRL